MLYLNKRIMRANTLKKLERLTFSIQTFWEKRNVDKSYKSFSFVHKQVQNHIKHFINEAKCESVLFYTRSNHVFKVVVKAAIISILILTMDQMTRRL